MNVKRFRGTRDEIDGSASLTQNAMETGIADYRTATQRDFVSAALRFSIRQISPAHALASSPSSSEASTKEMMTKAPTANTRVRKTNE